MRLDEKPGSPKGVPNTTIPCCDGNKSVSPDLRQTRALGSAACAILSNSPHPFGLIPLRFQTCVLPPWTRISQSGNSRNRSLCPSSRPSFLFVFSVTADPSDAFPSDSSLVLPPFGASANTSLNMSALTERSKFNASGSPSEQYHHFPALSTAEQELKRLQFPGCGSIHDAEIAHNLQRFVVTHHETYRTCFHVHQQFGHRPVPSLPALCPDATVWHAASKALLRTPLRLVVVTPPAARRRRASVGPTVSDVQVHALC